MRSATKSWLAVMLGGLLAVGCGLGDDDPLFPQQDKGGNLQRDGGGVVKVPAPVLNAPPTMVCTEKFPLQGWAQPGTTVVVKGAANDVSADPASGSGAFCVDVTVVKNRANKLEVYAHHPKLGLSPAAKATVTHQKCSDDIKNPPKNDEKSKNVALGMTARAKDTADSGNEKFLTDGDSSTFAQYSESYLYLGAEFWVTIKLEKLVEVNKIVVKWKYKKGDTETHYATKYKVLTSTGTPGDPDLKNGYWSVMRTITDGDGGIDTHDFSSSQPLVQHVALWMERDGNGGITSWGETFAIAEIEVWDVPKKSGTTPGPVTKTCATIGSN